MERRLWKHLAQSRLGKYCDHKNNWIRSLAKRGLKPIIEPLEVLQNVTDHEWQEAERFWIDNLRFLGFRLTNTAYGGIGGCALAKETIEKIRIARRAKGISPENREKLNYALRHCSPELRALRSRFMKGKRPSPETRAKLSAIRRGKKRSPESIRKFIASATGKKRTHEFCERMSRLLTGKKQPLDVVQKRLESFKATIAKRHAAKESQQLELVVA